MKVSERFLDEVQLAVEQVEPAKQREIAERVHRGLVHCKCCGRETEDFRETQESVTEALMELIDRNRVRTDVDWNYEINRND